MAFVRSNKSITYLNTEWEEKHLEKLRFTSSFDKVNSIFCTSDINNLFKSIGVVIGNEAAADYAGIEIVVSLFFKDNKRFNFFKDELQSGNYLGKPWYKIKELVIVFKTIDDNKISC